MNLKIPNLLESEYTNHKDMTKFYIHRGIQLAQHPEMDKQFDFINTRDKVNLLKRTDPQLTPGENLEYLHSINFSLSTKAIEFAEYWDKLVMSGQGSKWPNKGKPVRF